MSSRPSRRPLQLESLEDRRVLSATALLLDVADPIPSLLQVIPESPVTMEVADNPHSASQTLPGRMMGSNLMPVQNTETPVDSGSVGNLPVLLPEGDAEMPAPEVSGTHLPTETPTELAKGALGQQTVKDTPLPESANDLAAVNRIDLQGTAQAMVLSSASVALGDPADPIASTREDAWGADRSANLATLPAHAEAALTFGFISLPSGIEQDLTAVATAVVRTALVEGGELAPQAVATTRAEDTMVLTPESAGLMTDFADLSREELATVLALDVGEGGWRLLPLGLTVSFALAREVVRQRRRATDTLPTVGPLPGPIF